MVEIVNNQRKFELDSETFSAFTKNAISQIEEAQNKSVTVGFVSNGKMRELNKQFRDKNSTTDVLSFRYKPEKFETDINNLGDIVISVAQAEKQSRENQLTLEHELKQLILHGILHLCGFDHEKDAGEMNAREQELREVLGI